MIKFRESFSDYKWDHWWVFPACLAALMALSVILTMAIGLWSLCITIPLWALYLWLTYPSKACYTKESWYTEDE